ncbi:calcium-binding protein [Aliiroseovarius crassostreae]|uniref:calcium-binding protein n=1 Tax=Aliiroseovarius crassostreae TaxID=154981 RepID=UPI003C7B428E
MMFGAFLAIGLAGWGLVELFDGSDEADEKEGQVLTGTDQADRLEGDSGDDTISGKGGSDTLIGGEGDDSIEGGDRQDILFGGEGDDTLSGGRGADILAGNEGNDTLEGGNWDDMLFGGAGEDLLEGGSGDDVLVGGFLDQEPDGDATDMTPELWDALKSDLTSGTLDLSSALGGSADTVAESINVKGAEVPSGTDGADTLIGGEGNDTIALKSGDIAWGDGDGVKSGQDTFVLDARFAGDQAVIQDFVKGEDQIIVEYDKNGSAPTLTVEKEGAGYKVLVDGQAVAMLNNPQGGEVKAEDVTLVGAKFV